MQDFSDYALQNLIASDILYDGILVDNGSRYLDGQNRLLIIAYSLKVNIRAYVIYSSQMLRKENKISIGLIIVIIGNTLNYFRQRKA